MRSCPATKLTLVREKIILGVHL